MTFVTQDRRALKHNTKRPKPHTLRTGTERQCENEGDIVRDWQQGSFFDKFKGGGTNIVLK